MPVPRMALGAPGLGTRYPYRRLPAAHFLIRETRTTYAFANEPGGRHGGCGAPGWDRA